MRDFKKRRGSQGQFLRMVAGFAGLLLLGFGTYLTSRAAWDIYGKFAAASEASAAAQRQVAELERQYAAVSAAVEDLSTERGREAELRQRYGVARPGEGQIDIVRPKAAEGEGAAQPAGLLGRIWHALFVW